MNPKGQLTTSFVRIAREGPTIDGREIPAEHIEQMAKNYDPEVYSARINKEHFRSRLWEDELPILGDVVALSTDKDKDGKICLTAQLAPTSHLLALNEKRQKVFTSIEYDVDAVDGKEGAYLFGLAVTDSPASTGTEMLKFSIEHKDSAPKGFELDHTFSAYTETALNVETPKDTNKGDDNAGALDKKQFSALQKEVKELRESAATGEQLSDLQNKMEKLSSDYDSLKSDYDTLKEQLETTTSSNYRRRKPADGGAEVVTDC